MRSLVISCALVVACKSTPSHCPTAADITRLGASDDEAAILVERCQRDGWPETVGRCLKDARDDAAIDGCLKTLSPAQAEALRAAFKPLNDDHDKRDRAEALEMFHHKVGELQLERVTAAAPGCASYRKAIAELASKTADCGGDSASLRLFGQQEMVAVEARALAAIQDPAALAAACAGYEAEHRREHATVCDQPK